MFAFKFYITFLLEQPSGMMFLFGDPT